MKKAFLVQTAFLSRVVVDVNEDGEIQDWDSLLEQVKSSLRTKMSNDEVEENIETFFPDDEMPYGTYPDENWYDNQLIIPEGQGLIQYD